jgi:hypothetical protein
MVTGVGGFLQEAVAAPNASARLAYRTKYRRERVTRFDTLLMTKPKCNRVEWLARRAVLENETGATMQTRGLACILVLAGALLGGCSEGPYVYRPAQTSASLAGLPAARQSIPRDKPSGEIVVASSGVTEIKTEQGSSRAIFVRAVVSNQSDDTPWGFDTRAQAAIVGGQRVTAAYANAYEGYDGSTSVVRVPKGQSRTVDFYFPLPSGAQADDDIPPFELSWSVRTSRELVADRTPFNRVHVEPVYAGDPYPYPYYGPYGWYDPFWPPLYVGVGIGYAYPARYYYGYPRGPYYRGGGVYFRGRLR